MTDIVESDVPTTEALQAQLATANARLVHAELKSHAIRAGILDLDGLKLMDQSKLVLDGDGNIAGAPALMEQLKRDKPWLFAKPNSSHPAAAPIPEPPKQRMAKEMTYREW
jgi:hypothetical protein